ncbi:hypothetical protein BT96DRAFT_988333 [Gymnopus androsaceus JB14]|uniref:Uncharacterized protein n=1 Tax=Gymnopus androsaceus JB14 TaxID=1447944 RepID=A0A6A4I4Y0_9AGAR|nr:hypothetical protein BT96DRAFT_988333 [Gymnopus androsaceus JB14]
MSTNTPPKSIRSRMGTAMRRTSSVLSLGGSRPTTPGVASPKPSQIPTSRARSSSVATSASDTSSVSRPSIDTSVPIVPTPSAVKPSPIAESPSREAAATAEDIREELREPLRPTPLAQVVTASTEPETPVETRESEKTQPAIIGSANGPNTFTEEPEEMSLRGARSNESLQSNPAALTTNASGEPPAPASDTASEDAPNAPVKAAEPSYFELPANPPPEPLSDSASLHHAIIENTIGAPADDVSDRTSSDQDQTTPRPHGPADTENANVFYAFSEIPTPTPVPDIQEDKPTSEPIAILKETEQEIPTPAPAPDIQGQPSSEPISIPKETKRGDVDVIEREVSNSARLAEPSQNKPEEDIVEVPTAGPTVEPIPILLNPKQDDISLVQMPTPEIPGSKQPLPETFRKARRNVATLPGIPMM